MAKDRTQVKHYEDIAVLLRSGRLNVACALLSMHFGQKNAYRLAEEAQRLKEDNKRLLDYFAKGSDDPHRKELRDSLMDRAWNLLDQLNALSAKNKTLETETPVLTKPLEELTATPDDDVLLGNIFELIAESPKLHKEDRKALHEAILDELLPEYVRCTLLGAMSLLLVQRFDAKLVEYLYIYTLDDQPMQLQARAWVTLVFVALMHEQRIMHLPRLREQYQLLAESEPQLLFGLQIALLQCREAYGFDEKMNELMDPADDEEQLPTKEKVQEFMSLISDGVDMSISSFTHLKQMDFFSKPCNRHHWMEPFSLEEPHVREVLEKHPKGLTWTKLMMQSVAQCETDKYAAFLSMNAMDAGLLSKISQKLDSTGITLEEIPLRLPVVLRNHLHDQFRYYQMHPKAMEMDCIPFDKELNLSRNLCLQAAFSKPEQQIGIADFLFRKNRWEEAARAYYALSKLEVNEEILQRLVYSLQEAKNQEFQYWMVFEKIEPTELLVKCNKLYPGNKWTERHLADALDKEHRYDSEEQYLIEALSIYPDDTGLLARMGRCLTKQGRTKEALSHLYKADVQKEGQLIVQRELARALFLTRDNANAERYVRKILSRPTPSAEDWRLGANIAMQAGDITLAIERLVREDADNPYDLTNDLCREELQQAGIDLAIVELVNEVYSDQYDAIEEK